MELKEKLVALRKEKGLTQLVVAEKLNVSRQAISRWESGTALPSTDNLRCLGALYEVPIILIRGVNFLQQRHLFSQVTLLYCDKRFYCEY